jgi:dihydroorotase
MANRSLLAGAAAAVGLLIGYPAGAQEYDLLLQGGHVIDGRNKLSGPRDIALKDGKVAAVESKIDPARALKTVNVKGLYVVPGLIDIHAHVYTNTGERASYAGDNSVPPDGFTYRNGITTVVDAGRFRVAKLSRFQAAHHRSIKTRVLAFLNIVGNGMRGGSTSTIKTIWTARKRREWPCATKG